MAKPTQSATWIVLQDQHKRLLGRQLDSFFVQDSLRTEKMSVSTAGINFDFSRSHVDDEVMKALVQLAKDQKVEKLRAQMFAGEKINTSEGRAVLHTALRVQHDAPICVEGVDVLPQIRKTRAQLEKFVGDVREGRWLGATGRPICDVVSIGIGGSDLGPRLVVGALRAESSGPKVHFVANVDAAELDHVLTSLNPATTLFVIVSKTFTTQETLLNAQSARAWLVDALGEAAVAQHFVAVSVNQSAVQAFGIQAENMFAMWDWIGGRYSLWSSVGVCIALSIGWSGFLRLLAGAAAMDQHFLTSPLENNAPVLAALFGIWYRNFWNTCAVAILPYSERLRDLPRYLQQLDMESNGKSVTRDGQAVDYQTGPIVFGECGSVGQHSFHQWFHQGTGLVPADFIGVCQDDLNYPEHHKVLQAHMLAQVEAFKSGCASDDLVRANVGDKPSTLIWLDRLDAFSLGALLAFYEHKIFVQGAVWDINSFDQFGVELGKKLAQGILAK